VGRSRIAAWLVVVIAVVAVAGCGEDSAEAPSTNDAAAGHVHGLGVDPADGSLYAATHGGLFRAAEGDEALSRVGTSEQDTMGFTVVGPNRFLGSGHPGPGQERPVNLGLIESDDAGESWQPVSLAGEADFHVLRYAHGRIYAYNGLSGKLMLSDDGGKTWTERTPPEPIIDLAVDPANPERILVSSERGLALSDNDGESWKPVEGDIGLLAWPRADSLYLMDASGQVSVAKDASGNWNATGTLGGQPVAFAAVEDELLAALADGAVFSSSDAGSSWEPRASL
jgi:photosystem II stability/assembly factor-like uncharacterized protein